MSSSRVVGRVRWTSLYHPGTEVSTLASTREGWRLSGIVRMRFPEGPTAVRYRVDCSPDWLPRSAEIGLRSGGLSRRLLVRIDSERGWEVGGFPRQDLQRCPLLDLSATPATNTLALRHLALPVGAAREVSVAWISFPDLDVRPVVQRYTRLGDSRYRYEGLHNGFSAEFEVDALGFVRDYPGFWERARAPPKRRVTRSTPRRRTKHAQR
jgi:hypothetical protein